MTTIFISLSIIRDLLRDLRSNSLDLTSKEKDTLSKDIVRINDIITTENGEKDNIKFFSMNELKFENEFLKIIQTDIFNFDDDNMVVEKYNNQKDNEKNIFLAKEYGLIESGDKRTTKSKKSYKNYKLITDHFYEKIEMKDDSEKFQILRKYYMILSERVKFIPFHLDNYEKAFLYFEVLNDRGLEVSALDLIKNHCLLRCEGNSEKMSVIFDSWKKIFADTLDKNTNSINFIRYAYMAGNGHIQKKKSINHTKIFLSKKHTMR